MKSIQFRAIKKGEYFLTSLQQVPFFLDGTKERVPTRLIDGVYLTFESKERVYRASKEEALKRVQYYRN